MGFIDMETSNRKILTFPNFLSMFRIALIPLFVWLYSIRHRYDMSLSVLLLSGLTDIMDGWIARRFQVISELGKVLDPVADKLTQGAIILCLAYNFPIMWILLVVLITKETVMGIMGIIVLKKTGTVNSAKWHGKLATCLVYGTMIVHILYRETPVSTTYGLIVLCILSIVASLTLYLIRYMKLIKIQNSI